MRSLKASSTAALVAAAILVGTVMTASAKKNWLAGSQWGYPQQTGKTDRRYVRFATDGLLYVNGGCNNFRGSYDQNDKAITIDPLDVTGRTCEDDIMAAERSFITALTNTRSIAAEQHRLVLFDEDGKQLLRLARQDFD